MSYQDENTCPGLELSLNETQLIGIAIDLWSELGDVGVNNDGTTQDSFTAIEDTFPAGTDIHKIYKWFEEELEVSVAYLMGHRVHPITGRKEDL